MLAASTTTKDEPPELSSASSKIAIIGNEAVGKTALVRVLLGLSFPTTHSATFEDTFEWTAAASPLSIFDMAGAAAYDRLRPFSYPGIPAFLICFSVDERRSFRDVEDKWVPELQYYVPGVRIHLAALKTDLRDDPETTVRLMGNAEEAVSEAEGREMATRIGAVGYGECSALKNVVAVRELFEELLTRETMVRERKMPQDEAREVLPDPPAALEASDSIAATVPETAQAAAASPGGEAKASTMPNVTRKPSLTTSRVSASNARPSPSPSAPTRRPSTTSLSRRTSVLTLRKPDAIPTPPTTPKLSRIETSVARRSSLSKSSTKVPSSPQLTNSPTSSIPSSARQSGSTVAQVAFGSPTAGVSRRPSTSRLAASAAPSPTAVTRRPSLGSARLTPAAAASPTTARRAATPAGEHRRGSLPSLAVKTTTIASPAVHAINSTLGTATSSITAAPAAEPVIMPIRRNGVTTPASTTPGATTTSTLRSSPSTTRLAATASSSSAASNTAATKKSHPETLTTPTIRKRNSISSLWKRDAAGGAVAAGPARADQTPQEQQKQQQRPVLRSASVKSTARTTTAATTTTAVASAAAQKPVPRVAEQPQPSQQRSDTLSVTVAPPVKGKEKEKKVPVWERLAGLAKKKVDKQQPSTAATAASAGSGHRSWH
ncbi:hypothetical protein HDU87_003810 [Geranomyces variabilis]|uniref:Uncharacterized protein n=1 Tax=Geranomyces variabilis TaxID=109894 RepID=A0AAD5TK55_9FUNG|nr:hypothetical protein HDU87_003810 [Geranomyces variabilis]